MIVKNEEGYLKDCLEPISKCIDEIIIVDTGSSDNTKGIAYEFTEQVYEYEFHDDFSKARNFSISKANGDWILMLDADERLDKNNYMKLRKELEEINDLSIMALRVVKYNFFKNGGWYISNAVKVFRNDFKIYFNGAIHESVTQSIKENKGKIINSKSYLNHIGHTKPYKTRSEKNIKYIRLFEDRLLNNSADLSTLGYLAVLYRAEGDFKKALFFCKQADNLENAKYSVLFQLFSGHVYKGNGDLEEAKKRYEKAYQLAPNDATIWSNLGTILICMGRFEDAVSLLKRGIKLFPDQYYLFVNLGLAYQFLQKYHMALECFKYAEKGNPLLGHEDVKAKLEYDPYYIYYLETIPHYAGLQYHKCMCKYQIDKNCN